MSFAKPEDEEDKSVETKKKKAPPPPDDIDYWTAKLEWPRLSLEAEKPAQFGPVDVDGTVGSIEDIREDLRKHAAWDSSFLDCIGQELAELGCVLQVYKQLYLGEEAKPDGLRERDGLTQLPKTFLTELEEREEKEIQRFLDNQRRMRSLASEQGHSPGQYEKTVQKQTWPVDGQSGPVPSLPHPVDSFFIVDKIARVETGAGQKVWKRVCYCKGALKMLQGTFWWFWMDKFKPNKSLQSNLFDIIAKTFVSIILPMSLEESDKFIEHYPRCLAEAVFCVFLDAYPQSVRTFDSDFRRDLANVLASWITGLKAAPGSWNSWPVLASLPLLSAAEAEQESERALRQVVSARQALASMQKELDEGHVRFHSTRQQREDVTRGADQQYFVKESHPIGIGMEFERIRFTVFSRSPLVHHYLLLHQLTVKDYNQGQGLTRTELTAVPDQRALTYNDYLVQLAQDQHQKYTDYQTETAKRSKDITKMLKDHAAALREMERRNKELLGRKHEVKVMSEKLVEQLRNTHPSFSKDKALSTDTSSSRSEGGKEQGGQTDAAASS